MSRFTCAVFSGLALCIVGCADQRSARSTTPDAVAAEVSGGSLKDVRDVWYRLGMTRAGEAPTAFRTTGRPAGYDAGPFSAQVFRVDLGGDARGVGGGTDTVVRIGDGAAWDWQFLAFLDSPEGWRYAGSIDLPDNRLGAPTPEVRTLGPGRSWLVVKSYRQASPAITQQDSVWYQARNGRIVEVLRAPAEGRRAAGAAPFDVAYRGEIIDTALTTDNEVAVTVSVEAVYTNARKDAFPNVGELFRRTGVIRYVQSNSTGRFSMDPKSSAWSQPELDALLTADADVFVRMNPVQIAQLARSGDDARRRWLARLAQDCSSPETRSELTSLAGVETDR